MPIAFRFHPFVVLLSTASLLAVGLVGCAPTQVSTLPPPAPVVETIVPNEHLRVQGIPPVPKALADRVGKYTEFRPTGVIAWHPKRRAMLLAYRRGATTQLHLLDRAMGTLEPLTDFPDPVSSATFEPKRGDYLVYARDSGGNEASQLYRYDFTSREATLLTDPSEKHEFGEWNHAGTALLMESTQLDKTGKRDTVTTDLHVLDPRNPDAKRKVASLQGGGWGRLSLGAGRPGRLRSGIPIRQRERDLERSMSRAARRRRSCRDRPRRRAASPTATCT